MESTEIVHLFFFVELRVQVESWLLLFCLVMSLRSGEARWIAARIDLGWSDSRSVPHRKLWRRGSGGRLTEVTAADK